MPSAVCSFCAAPNLAHAAYCRSCQRPLAPRARPEPSSREKKVPLARRATEAIDFRAPKPAFERPQLGHETSVTEPPQVSPARRSPSAPSFATEAPQQESQAERLRALSAAQRNRAQMQQAPTEMVDLIGDSGEKTEVSPLMASLTPSSREAAPPPRTRASAVPTRPITAAPPKPEHKAPSPAEARSAPPVNALSARLRADAATGQKRDVDSAPWLRTLLASVVDFCFSGAMGLIWVGIEAWVTDAVWPAERGSFLEGLAVWLHGNGASAERGFAIAILCALLHSAWGAKNGRTLGRLAAHIRLAAPKAKPPWAWATLYAIASVGTTLLSGVGLYYMLVDARARPLPAALMGAELLYAQPS